VPEQNNTVYEFGPFRLDVQKRLLARDGEIVSLKPKAFDTLLALIRADGQVVGKDELMSRVWPDTIVEEGNLTFNISTLRKALGDDPRRHEYIVTIPGEGYQFVAGVRARFDELVVHESTSITIEEEDEVAPQRTLPGEPIKSRRLMVVLVTLLVGAAVGVAIFWLVIRRQFKELSQPILQIDIARVTSSGKVKYAAISPDGKYVAQITNDAQGDSLFISQIGAPQNVLLAGPARAEYVAVTFAPDGDAVYYLTLDREQGHTVLYRVPLLGGPSTLAAEDVGPIGFSPDGKQIAFVRKDAAATRLFISSLGRGEQRVVATLNQPQYFRVDWHAPAWSPDGETIACQARLNDERGHFETVAGVNIADGSIAPLTSARWNFVDQPVWLADGSGLLVTASENESAPNQVWHIDRTGKATRVTHDLNSYSGLSLTKDSARVVAVQDQNFSSVWTSKEIFSEVGLIEDVTWTIDNRILYRSTASGTPEIWVMNSDGSNRKQLTVDAGVSRGLSVSPDGQYIFFASDRGGHFNIWRVDSSGGHMRQLTNGDGEFFPQSTPDSKWVVYQQGEMEPRLWKISVAGGPAVQLTDTRAARPAVSPDGLLIAYHYLDPEVASSRWRIGVISTFGGPRLRQFDLPAVTPNTRLVRWSPDGQVAYPDGARGLAEIWLQSFDGSAPRQLTDFKAEQILCFDWSRDGKTLAVVRTVKTSDTVLITHRRGAEMGRNP
jgi:Tol biopolymer transport system component/DNA-binding winged helix-turn-helix (wHTH) protein